MREHCVQFFDSDDSRAQAVSAVLATGYADDRPIMVIARSRNWLAIRQRLEAAGVPVEHAMATGRVVSKDASETLRRITRNGSPDAKAFDATVGATVAALGAKGPVCVYGEMVDMLAQAGDLADAVKLEVFWNSVAPQLRFSMMCGYSAAHFVAASSQRTLREICRAHSRVYRHAQDPLASWLLDAAHGRSDVAPRAEI
jgi:hypothetical protein